jgi:phosphoribosylglycinamide formyltransferase-1
VNRVAVLVSGNGSNLQALIDATASGRLDAEIACVVSNSPGAFAVTRAERAGIPAAVLELGPLLAGGRSRREYDEMLADLVAGFEPDLVVLAGWMLILGTGFLSRFPDRVINLHPALPGTFPGTHAIERAYAAFRAGEIEDTGVMVHRVVPEVDAGPVLVSATVPIRAGESCDQLEARIHVVEHRLIVAAVRQVLESTATP